MFSSLWLNVTFVNEISMKQWILLVSYSLFLSLTDYGVLSAWILLRDYHVPITRQSFMWWLIDYVSMLISLLYNIPIQLLVIVKGGGWIVFCFHFQFLEKTINKSSLLFFWFYSRISISKLIRERGEVAYRCLRWRGREETERGRESS